MKSYSMIGLAGLLVLAAVPAPAADDKPDLTVDMALPILRSWVPPVYPKEAAERRLDGRVQVRFVIDQTGTVVKARALHATDPVFEAAAVESVRLWRFDPAEEDGRKVAKCMDVVLPFSRADLRHPPTPGMPPAEIVRDIAYAPTTRAQKVSGDDPNYPDSLLARNLTGEVDVEFTVGPDGRAQGPRILWATHADFIVPALTALDKWTFSPAMQGDLTLTAKLQSALMFDVVGSQNVDKLAANGVTLSAAATGTFDSRPEMRIVVDPVYPYDLRLAGTEGEAEADFVIGAKGIPEKVTVRQATNAEFGRALEAALECWLFNPAMKGDTPVAVPARCRWKFSLAAGSPEIDATERLVQRLRGKDTADLGARGLDGRLRPVYQVSPFYPAALLGEKPQGTAAVEFIIDRDGRCRLARILSASREEFGWAAATAVERWVFNPPTRSGRPTDVRVSIPFDFKPPS